MVCAEIPDEKSNPRLHELVSRWMVHGPCGLLGVNNNSEACITVSIIFYTPALNCSDSIFCEFHSLNNFKSSKLNLNYLHVNF